MLIYRLHGAVRAAGDYTGAFLAGGRWNPPGTAYGVARAAGDEARGAAVPELALHIIHPAIVYKRS